MTFLSTHQNRISCYTHSNFRLILNKLRHVRFQGDLKCDVCEEVIKFLDSYIEKNASIDKINETLYRLCSGLPSGAIQDLVSMVV